MVNPYVTVNRASAVPTDSAGGSSEPYTLQNRQVVPARQSADSSLWKIFSKVAPGAASTCSQIGNAFFGNTGELYKVAQGYARSCVKNVFLGSRMLSGEQLNTKPEGIPDNVWELFQGAREKFAPCIGNAIKNGISGWQSWAVTNEDVDSLVNQFAYALLVGIKEKLAEQGLECSLKNLLLHVANSLEAAQRADSSDASFDILITSLFGRLERLPFTDTAIWAIKNFVWAEGNFSLSLHSWIRGLSENFIGEAKEGVHILLGRSGEDGRSRQEAIESLKASLERAYGEDEASRAAADASTIDAILFNLIEGALEKTEPSLQNIVKIADLVFGSDARLSEEEKQFKAEVVNLFRRFLSSSPGFFSTLKDCMGKQLTVSLVKFIQKFVEAHPEDVKNHKAQALVKVLADFVAGRSNAFVEFYNSTNKDHFDLASLEEAVLSLPRDLIIDTAKMAQLEIETNLLQGSLQNIAQKMSSSTTATHVCTISLQKSLEAFKASNAFKELSLEQKESVMAALYNSHPFLQLLQSREQFFRVFTADTLSLFGSTPETVHEVFLSLPLPEKTIRRISDIVTKETLPDLCSSFYDHITSVLVDEGAIRGSVRQIYGTQTKEDLENLTPAEFAAKQIGDYTARYLPDMLQNSKNMLAKTTIGFVNTEFESLFGMRLFSLRGAQKPADFLEATYEAVGKFVPESAWQLLAKVVDNTCQKAFVKLGENLQNLQKREDGAQVILGLVKTVLTNVTDHFQALSLASFNFGHLAAYLTTHSHLLTEFGKAQYGEFNTPLLDPALRNDLELYAKNAAGILSEQRLQELLDKNRMEEFYEGVFGKNLIDVAGIKECDIPLDPLLQGVVLSMLQDTVLPSVFKEVFNNFVKRENFNQLLIMGLDGVCEQIRSSRRVRDMQAGATDEENSPRSETTPEVNQAQRQIRDQLHVLVEGIVDMFPNSILTGVIRDFNNRGVITDYIWSELEKLTTDEGIISLLNEAFSLADLRKTGPTPPEAPDVDEFEGKSLSQLKKMLKSKIRDLIFEGYKALAVKIFHYLKDIVSEQVKWLEEHVGNFAAMLLLGVWFAIMAVPALFAFLGLSIALSFTYLWFLAKSNFIVENINMPIHENMVLCATRSLLDTLREQIAYTQDDSSFGLNG